MKRYGTVCWAAVGLALIAMVGRSAETQGPPVTTNVVVRVVGNHGMPLGDTVGGAVVTIKDVETGAILASGTQTGSTGDLRAIMQTPRLPTEQIFSTKDSASFKAELALSKPTVVEVIGEGPLKYPAAKRRASMTVLLYPGKPITGDGIVLQLYGMIVQIETPKPTCLAFPHPVSPTLPDSRRRARTFLARLRGLPARARQPRPTASSVAYSRANLP